MAILTYFVIPSRLVVMSEPTTSPRPTTEDPTASNPEASAEPTQELSPTPVEPTPVEPTMGEPATSGPADSGAADDTATGTRADAAKPSERIRIGTQRVEEQTAAAEEPLAPKPVTPVTVSEPAKKASKYPPPNARAALTEEQEAELEAAMAGASVDELINQSAAAAAVELAPETKVTGRVKSRHAEFLFVDLGGHLQGVIPLKQFNEEPPAVDSEIECVVAKLNADEGLYELNLPTAATEVGNWDEVEVGQIIEVSVTGVNKGGLECQAAGIRGFMPMGQISLYRVEKPEDYVGQKIAAVVTEANRERRNLVLSHRAVMERERAEKREKLLAELAPGQMREGVVRSLRDFGAFVDLGGVDGLIHVSRMSWDRVNHPSEVLSEGQNVKVKVEKIDPETGKIGLSYRESAENPWDAVDSKYPTGSKVTGKVSKVMDFGAFVKLESGVEGLIHISELAHGRVFRTGDAVAEGQQVEVKVLSVDREKQRIGLSLKALSAPPTKAKDDSKEDAMYELPPDAPKAPKKKAGELKGGTGGPSGGEKFGLKW
ncbi:MAG: S1 RNA-binding domain-containing protein [Planctomycetota bacterium]